MKAEKDAWEVQNLAMACQRQNEQVRQNILIREQTQHVATIPACNLLLFIYFDWFTAYGLADCLGATIATKRISVLSLNRRSKYNNHLHSGNSSSSNTPKPYNCTKYKPNNKAIQSRQLPGASSSSRPKA